MTIPLIDLYLYVLTPFQGSQQKLACLDATERKTGGSKKGRRCWITNAPIYGLTPILSRVFYPTGIRSMNRRSQLVFVALSAFVFSAKAQTDSVPPGLPTSIPTFANMNQLYEYQATNKPNFVGVSIYYTPSIPGGANVRQNLAALTTFTSLNQMYNYILTNAVGEVASVANANASATASLHVRVFSSGYQPYDSMDIDVTNAALNGMTVQWISNNLTFDSVYVNINVPGLQSLDIQAQTSSNTYSFHTNLVAKTGTIAYVPPATGAPPFPPERTTTDWLVLNPWYLLQTNKVRFTVSTSTGSQEYTQLGAAILPPLTAMSGSLIQASVAAGSDATLLWSDSLSRPLSAWQTNSVSPWSLNTNAVRWNVGLSNHAGFFMIRLD